MCNHHFISQSIPVVYRFPLVLHPFLSFALSLTHSVSFQLSLPYHYSSAGKSCIVDTLQINAKFSNLLLKLNDNRVYSIEQQFSEMFEWIKVTCSIHIYLLFGSSFWTITLARRLELHWNIHLHIYTWHQVLFTLLIWLFAFSQLVQLIFNTDHFIQLRSVYNVYILCVYHFTIWFRNHRKKLTVEHKR